MRKRFSAIIAMCLVLTSCMSSGPPPSLAYGNCTNLCNFVWWETASTADVKAEIKSGANVNARDEDGMTPLHHTAKSKYGKPAIIKLLIDAGALVNARDDDGDTPLHYAVVYGTADTVKMLLNAGADPNAQNYAFNNPFIHGSSVKNALTSEWITARPEWPEIANLLQAAGSETKNSTVDKTKRAACIASGLILWDLECAKY